MAGNIRVETDGGAAYWQFLSKYVVPSICRLFTFYLHVSLFWTFNLLFKYMHLTVVVDIRTEVVGFYSGYVTIDFELLDCIYSKLF